MKVVFIILESGFNLILISFHQLYEIVMASLRNFIKSNLTNFHYIIHAEYNAF